MGMTKAERTELLQLLRKRERVMKSKAQERSAALLAEFEAHAAKIYHWDDDSTWAKVKADTDSHIAAAQAAIDARCRELGIPGEFGPKIGWGWNGRGAYAAKERRDEMRRVAKARIQAMELEAVAKIEHISLDAQTKLLGEGLTSEAAGKFLNDLSTVDSLMPALAVDEIQALVETKAKERAQRYLN